MALGLDIMAWNVMRKFRHNEMRHELGVSTAFDYRQNTIILLRKVLVHVIRRDGMNTGSNDNHQRTWYCIGVYGRNDPRCCCYLVLVHEHIEKRCDS